MTMVSTDFLRSIADAFDLDSTDPLEPYSSRYARKANAVHAAARELDENRQCIDFFNDHLAALEETIVRVCHERDYARAVLERHSRVDMIHTGVLH